MPDAMPDAMPESRESPEPRADEGAVLQRSDLLVAAGVGKSYGSVTAVDHVDLAVGAGEFVAIVGRSGSGKTTLLSLLAGLDAPDKGTVRFRGEDLPQTDEDALAEWRGRHVGLVFQSFHLVPTLSALENAALPLYPRAMSTAQRRDRAGQRLEQVGLGHRLTHRPAQLSGGEQQRVAIARALVGEPAIVLADEPTGNLDTATGAEILALFQRLREETGIALAVVTHDEKVASIADRQIRLQDGKVVE
jgi:putative ABC transport system ATP-binding protein